MFDILKLSIGSIELRFIFFWRVEDFNKLNFLLLWYWNWYFLGLLVMLIKCCNLFELLV